MRRYRTYSAEELKEWIPKLAAKNELLKFYKTHAWLHVRDDALRKQHYECQLCKEKGLFVPATVAHHIKTVRQRPDLALDENNLMALCDECHYQIHHKHDSKWNDEKW